VNSIDHGRLFQLKRAINAIICGQTLPLTPLFSHRPHKSISVTCLSGVVARRQFRLVKAPSFFRDLIGKLEVLTIECDKCGRRGRYHLHRLIERYSIDAKLLDWSDEITAGLPTKAGEQPQRYLRCAVPGFVKGGLGFEIAYLTIASKWASWKLFDLVEGPDVRSNSFTFGKFGDVVF